MFHEGTIGLKTGKLAHFWIKVYEIGSNYGIDGGKISKLTIKIDGEIAANYDRVWDIKPTTDEAKEAYQLILSHYN